MRRIVVKIGSKVLTGEDNRLNEKVLTSLIKDIVGIKKRQAIDIVIVTSGAVALGRSVKDLADFKIESSAVKYEKAIIKEQILASLGQPKLMAFYISEFQKNKLDCAQILATRSVFSNRDDYLSLRVVTENLLKLGVIPVFNENDVLSPEELDFSDNDQLASMISAMLSADKLIILSNVDGVYENFSAGVNKRIIDEIADTREYENLIDDSKSQGKGGMKSKFIIADLVTSLGIGLQIANGKIPNVISKIIAGEKIGTIFPAKARKGKALKNWLVSAAVGKGKIYVSTYLAEVLSRKQVCSILFPGIEKIEGKFNKNEAVEICDESGKVFGVGLARFGAKELENKVNLYKKVSDLEKAKTKTADIIAVHYDYFSFC